MKIISRINLIGCAVAIGFLVLAFGLFQVQVVKGLYFRRMSENNRIRLIQLEAERGNVVDRNGELLASSRRTYNVFAIPEDFDPQDLSILSKLLNLDEKEIRKRMSEHRSASFTPVLLKEDVIKEEAIKLEEQKPRLSGVFIQEQSIRSYPNGTLGAHAIGYIGKISREEYEHRDKSLYHYNSWIGRAGIERIYDAQLRGEDGGRQLEVNARGVPIRLLTEREAVRGKDIQLTIDVKLESRLQNLLGEREGAIMILDLHSGELLALMSQPGFNPNIFVMPSKSQERLDVISSRKRPLLDRGLQGLYPPGSIFKLVTAMAALDSNLITPNTKLKCPGYFQLNEKSRMFKCWFHEGHGEIDLYTALERSCNVYFYQVGRLVGVKRLAEYARRLGFGSRVSMELPTAEGLVPDEVWKKNAHHEDWFAGDTISFAIGQSYLLTTPIQILRLVSAIATDGRVTEPRIVRAVGNLAGTNEFAGKTGKQSDKKVQLDSGDDRDSEKSATEKGIRRETFKAIRQGMLQAVASDKGTAQLARVKFGKLAAKTGTAQAPPGNPHAWFAGFYPFDQPEIAVVVFIERGKSGGLTAAKIAKQVVSEWKDIYVPAAV